MSRSSLMVGLGLILMAGAPSSGWGQQADSAESGTAEVKTRLAQARLFAKKKWFKDARLELEAALDLPAGQSSYEVHRLAHDVAWELQDVAWARAMAEGAARVAPAEGQQREAQALVDSYDRQFGFLAIDAPYDGVSSRLQLELQSVLFDPELKRFVNQVSLSLREKRALPMRVGLPVGTYTVNGHDVEIVAAQDTALTLPMNALGAKGLAALQVFRMEISAGMVAALGEDTKGIAPAPTVQIAATQPLGPVLLGLFAEGAASRFRGPSGSLETSSGAWSAGLRLGREIQTRTPLAIRPSLTVRALTQPGLQLGCAEVGGSQSCSPDSPRDDLVVYGVGTAIAPGLELSLDYREAGRTTALGTGVKVAVDQSIGGFPSEGTAIIANGDGGVLRWAPSDDAGWTATNLRVLANVSFAF